jgi:hypothetical protein
MANKDFNELSFVEILIGFIFVWIIASLWITFFKNLFHKTIGIDEKSTFQTFLVAITVSIIFLILVYTVGRSEETRLEKELGAEE